MLKKTITYIDFNGDEASEDHFFHLSQAELVEIEMSHQGGLSETLQKIIDDEDGGQIIAEFKKIILGSYGVKSSDGRRFVKNQKLREEFESSEAYSTLFMELVTETDKAVEFVNGIIPGDMAEKVGKITAADLSLVEKPENATVEESEDETPEPKIVTRVEINEMSREELAEFGAALAAGTVKLADDIPITREET